MKRSPSALDVAADTLASGMARSSSAMTLLTSGATADDALAGAPVLEGALESILTPLAPRTPLTKVICTVGVATRSVDSLVSLLEAGMSIARFDFSWGSFKYHQQTLDNLKEAMKRTKKMCGLMLDTRGCELAVPLAPPDVSRFDVKSLPQISLQQGGEIIVGVDTTIPASDKYLPIDFPELPQLLRPGSELFVGQYLFTGAETSSAYLTVQEVLGPDRVRCVVGNTCVLTGVLLTCQVKNLVDDLPCVCRHDVEAVTAFAVPNGIDFISLSFTKSAADVRSMRELCRSQGLKDIRIVAKIERKMALADLEAIIDESDGIMLSRGNLGLDLEPEKMFLAQKYVLQMCNSKGKPCIVSRVVDTMTDSPRPTRAEATDVANAVLDGADGILLGAETLRGLFPSESVRTVLSICEVAERVFNHEHFFNIAVATSQDIAMQNAEALASSAVRAAYKICASLIIVFTESGRTASLVAKYRPSQPVLCVVVPRIVRDSVSWQVVGHHAARGCLLPRGLFPLLANFNVAGDHFDQAGIASTMTFAMDYAKEHGMLKKYDRVVVVQKIGASAVVKVLVAE